MTPAPMDPFNFEKPQPTTGAPVFKQPLGKEIPPAQDVSGKPRAPIPMPKENVAPKRLTFRRYKNATPGGYAHQNRQDFRRSKTVGTPGYIVS